MTEQKNKNQKHSLLGGFSWAENIYEKLEKICTENDAIQVPCRYLDTVGDHLKKMIDDFSIDFLNIPEGRVNEVVPSFEHNNISGDCKESSERPENALENMSACPEVESIVSSVEDLKSLVSPVEDLKSLDMKEGLRHQNNCHQENTCDEHSIEPISEEVTCSNLSAGEENTCDEHSIVPISEEVTCSNLSAGEENTCDEHSIEPISEEVTCSNLSTGENFNESHQNEFVEGSMQPHVTSSTEIHGIDNFISQETVSLLGSPRDEHEQEVEPNKLEASEQLPETEISDDSDVECVFDTSDVITPTTKLMDLFENGNLDDSGDDAPDFVFDLVSHPVCKNAPYKKKLKQAVISMVLSVKRRKQVENRHSGIDNGAANRLRINLASISGRDLCLSESMAHDSDESDWVLVDNQA